MKKQFTATVYIVAQIDGEPKILLHKHKKLGKWFAVGGHIEDDENPYDAALREAKEETQLTVTIISERQGLIQTDEVQEVPPARYILEELIPGNGHEDQHIHIDFIYFGTITNPEDTSMDEEYRWFTIHDLHESSLNEEVLIISSQAIRLMEKYI